MGEHMGEPLDDNYRLNLIQIQHVCINFSLKYITYILL